MRYYVNGLEEIREILGLFQVPIAVIDFISGEMGHELLAAQVLGGLFYDFYRQDARVVALCWAGTSLLYSNVSDDQIELYDIKNSIRGNRKHQSGVRLGWLKQLGHSVKDMGVMAFLSLSPPSEESIKQVHGLTQTDLVRLCVNRVLKTQPEFEAAAVEIESPYILCFDRNERHQSGRNTKLWQIMLLEQLAQKHDLPLVVISGYYPKDLPAGIMRLNLRYRDLDLLCNLVQDARFFAGPASGLTTTALLFGCNFLALGRFYKERHEMAVEMIESRGLKYLGVLDEYQMAQALENIEQFLS